MFEYNSSKPNLILREYGRNIQKLVNHIKTIDDKDKRNRYAETLVELMRQLNPAISETNETNQKLWDDLFIMAEFDLDIDSPYPKPEEEILNKKPLKLGYSDNHIRFKHYGKNMEKLIEKALELEDKEEREGAIVYIGKLMRSFYSTWNKDNIEDESILKNIKELSKDELDIDLEKVKEHNLFESLYKERPSNNNNNKGSGKNRRHKGRSGGGRGGNNKSNGRRRRH